MSKLSEFVSEKDAEIFKLFQDVWVSELVSEYEVNQVFVRFRNMLRRFQTLWHFAKC